MANERTFLSWIRTATTFLSFGVTLLQIYRLRVISIDQHDAGQNDYISSYKDISIKSLLKLLTIMFIVIGFISTLFGAFRYFQVQGTLLRDYYPVARVLVFFLIAINIVLLIILLVTDIKITI